jgi:hypothetical protein
MDDKGYQEYHMRKLAAIESQRKKQILDSTSTPSNDATKEQGLSFFGKIGVAIAFIVILFIALAIWGYMSEGADQANDNSAGRPLASKSKTIAISEVDDRLTLSYQGDVKSAIEPKNVTVSGNTYTVTGTIQYKAYSTYQSKTFKCVIQWENNLESANKYKVLSCTIT